MHQSDMLYYDDSLQTEERMGAIMDRDEAKERYEALKEEESESTGGSTYEQAYNEVKPYFQIDLKLH